MYSPLVVGVVFWDASVPVQEGRQCSDHYRPLAASRHGTGGPLGGLSRCARGSAARNSEEPVLLVGQPVSVPWTVFGDPPPTHRSCAATHHPPRRARCGHAESFMLR